MLIDFHTHVYPEKIAEKGVQYIGDFYNLTMREKGTLVHLKSVAKASGTTHVVLLGVAVKPEVVESINRFTASLLDDSTFGFGTIHPDYPNKKEEICHCLEMGLAGIKIHPDMQAFYIDDTRMLEVYHLLSEKGAPIMIHMGDDRYDYSKPFRLARIMDMFPSLKVVGAHFGGYQCWEDSLNYLCGRRNLWLDTSSSLQFMDIELAKNIIHTHGYDRILFGTDYPITDQTEELKRIALLNLTEEETKAILYENAAKLLGICVTD